MTFDEWLNEIEGFGLRVERIHDDLIKNRMGLLHRDDQYAHWIEVKEWLEAAYDVGYSHGRTPTLESESSASDWAKKMWGGQFPPSGT